MHKDKPYTDYINNIKVKDNSGVFGYDVQYDVDDETYYDSKDIIPPNDKDRQQLAWANFTGPLSKYITDNKLFTYENRDKDPTTYWRFLNEMNITIFPQNIELTADKSAFKVKEGLDLTEKIKDSFGSLQIIKIC